MRQIINALDSMAQEATHPTAWWIGAALAFFTCISVLCHL